MSATFIGTCVGLPKEEIEAFDETSREITYLTFRRHIGKEVMNELDQTSGIPIRRDWHVRFFKGKHKGQPAACLMHSGIRHIWQLH